MTARPDMPMLLTPLLVVGHVLRMASLLCLPAFVIATMEPGDHWRAFLYTAIGAQVVSVLCLWMTGGKDLTLSIRQMFVATTLSWLAVCVVGAMPFMLGATHMTFTDSMFESMSGITTTGSTVLVGLDRLPDSTLLWRGLLQWLGGIGIVMLAISILPFLSVGGMRLFQTESSDWSGKSLPRIADIIKLIQLIYAVLTALIVLGYHLAGMNWFDAAIHSMSTISTGGFSNYDASLGHFVNRPAVLWTGTAAMALSAMPFMLFLKFLRGDRQALYRDQQVRGFVMLLAALSVILAVYQYLFDGRNFFSALTNSSFNVVSIITTTGYVSEDYTLWGSFAFIAFFYMTFIGGCSGSTTGGIKIFRFQIAIAMLVNQLKFMIHPRGVFLTTFNGEVVSDQIVRSLVAFSFFYGFTVAVIAFGLSWIGLDFLTALSSAATAVGNVGPGLGDTVGPASTFTTLPDAAKWVLLAGMLLGRLEILTVLTMLTPGFWK